MKSGRGRTDSKRSDLPVDSAGPEEWPLPSAHYSSVSWEPPVLWHHLARPAPTPLNNLSSKVRAAPAPTHARFNKSTGEAASGPGSAASGQARTAWDLVPHCPHAQRGAEGQCLGRDESSAPRQSSCSLLECSQSRQPSPETQEPRPSAGNRSNRQGARLRALATPSPRRVPRGPRPNSGPFLRGRAPGGGAGPRAQRAAGRAPRPGRILTDCPQHPRQATQPAVPPRHALLLRGRRGVVGRRRCRPTRAAHGAAVEGGPPPSQRAPEPAASAGALPCGRRGSSLA